MKLEDMVITTSEFLPKPGLTIYKPNRFIEYEDSDRWWIEKYGYGHFTPHTVYRIGGRHFNMHPDTLELLKKEIDNGNEPSTSETTADDL